MRSWVVLCAAAAARAAPVAGWLRRRRCPEPLSRNRCRRAVRDFALADGGRARVAAADDGGGDKLRPDGSAETDCVGVTT